MSTTIGSAIELTQMIAAVTGEHTRFFSFFVLPPIYIFIQLFCIGRLVVGYREAKHSKFLPVSVHRRHGGLHPEEVDGSQSEKTSLRDISEQT